MQSLLDCGIGGRDIPDGRVKCRFEVFRYLINGVAFEVTTTDYIARLVAADLAVAMLPRAYAPRLASVTTVDVTDAPARVEYVIWNRHNRSPAASALFTLLDIDRLEPST